MKIEYVIGDIIIVDTNSGLPGDAGVVVCLDKLPGLIGVRFNRPHKLFHDCGGKCEFGYGWYVPRCFVGKVS
jgi:hypothetical protein